MKKLIATLLLCTLLVTSFGLTASAAFVIDSNSFCLAGDANEDGTVNVCDLVKANIGAGNSVAADLDGNGTVGAYDFALIRAIILGIDNSLWTE